MPSIITRDLRYFNNKNLIESLSEVTPDNLYIFIGKSTAWSDENTPDTPVDSARERIQLYEDLIALKKISSNDATIVIENRQWVSSTVYDQFDDLVDMVEGINPDTSNSYQYYVITDEYNVYKCISNNNGASSTVKPTGTSVNSFETADGYIWKYMMTINASDILKYATDEWTPVRRIESNDGSGQWSVQTSAVDGSIEAIEMVAGGSGYSVALPPAITITGDGSGATAVPEIDSGTGEILRIKMTNIGSGYTEATITIDTTGTTGTGAQARAILSPIGGHGADPVSELGGKNAMLKVILQGDESGNLPIGIDYRQTGLILNPMLTETGTILTLSGVTGSYNVTDDIEGRTSGATGTVVKYDFYNKLLYVRTTSGSFAEGEVIEDTATQTQTATITTKATGSLPLTDSYSDGSDIQKGSGDILYINNRTKISRIDVQGEESRFVLRF